MDCRAHRPPRVAQAVKSRDVVYDVVV